MSQSARFLRLGCPPGLLFVLLAPFHLLPPLGVVLGTVTGDEDPFVSLLLAALATGTFLYVGAFEVVAEEFAEAGGNLEAPREELAVSPGNFAIPADSSDPDDALEAGCAGGRWAVCWPGGCLGAAAEASPVAGGPDEAGGGGDDAVVKGWMPGRDVKFVFFICGCGVLSLVTFALPHADDDVH